MFFEKKQAKTVYAQSKGGVSVELNWEYFGKGQNTKWVLTNFLVETADSPSDWEIYSCLPHCHDVKIHKTVGELTPGMYTVHPMPGKNIVLLCEDK